MSRRVGIIGPDGKVAKWPTEYVDESDFDRGSDPAPVRVGMGKGYFALIPPGMKMLPFVIRDAIMNEIKDLKEIEAARVKKAAIDAIASGEDTETAIEVGDEEAETPAAPTTPVLNTGRGNRSSNRS